MSDTPVPAVPPQAAPRWRRRLGLAVRCLLGLYALFCLLVLVTCWLILPRVNDYRDQIAARIGQALGAEVSIGAIEPGWELIWPRLRLREVTISKSDPRHAHSDVLRVGQAEASFYWRSALGRPSFRSLVIADTALTIRRTGPAAFEAAGISVDLSGPRDRAAPPVSGSIISWLLGQHEISVHDSRLTLIDLTDSQPSELVFEDLTAGFRRGLGHWSFGLQAGGRAEDGHRLDLRASFRTPLLRPSTNWRDWEAQAYLETGAIDLPRLLRGTALARWAERGQARLRVWAESDSGHWGVTSAQLSAAGLRLRLGPELEPLDMSELSARASLETDGDRLRLSLDELRFRDPFGDLMDTGGIDLELLWPAGRERPATASLSVAALDLAPLLRTLPRLPLPPELSESVIRHRVSGRLDNLSFTWNGEAAPASWRLSVGLTDLSADFPEADGAATPAPEAPRTGVRGLTARLEATPGEGRLSFDDHGLRLFLPRVFPEPELELRQLSGAVTWGRDENGRLRVGFERLRAANGDAAVTASGSWLASGGPGTIDLTGEVESARAESAWRYLPRLVKDPVRDWLRAGLVSGQASAGRFRLRGELARFPWHRPGDTGEFLVEARVSGGTIDYVPSRERDSQGRFVTGSVWPVLSDIEGSLRFEGDVMRVSATRAVTMGVTVTDASATIDHLGSSQAVLSVSGQAHDDLAKMLPYLTASPVGGFLGGSFDRATGAGDARLRLALDIPLTNAAQTRVSGSVTLSGDASLDLDHPAPPLSGLSGVISFSERGASAERITGKAFDRPVRASVSTAEDGTIDLDFVGSASPADLLWFQDSGQLREIFSHLEGELAITGQLSISRGRGLTLTARSDLRGVTSSLPAPLGKTAEQPWPSVFRYDSRARRDQSARISLDIGERIFSVLIQRPTADSGLPSLGAIAIGRQASLPRSGFALEIVGLRFNTDRWRPLLEKLAAADAEADNPSLERITVDVGSCVSQAIDFGALRARVERLSPTRWRARLNGDNIDGTVLLDTAKNGAVEAQLTRLRVPDQSDQLLKDILAERQGQDAIPSIKARVDDLSYGSAHLGQVELVATASVDGEVRSWRLDSLTVRNAGATLSGSGIWRHTPRGHGHAMKADIKLSDTGVTLSELGHPEIMTGGSGETRIDLSWHGLPWAPRLDTVNGSVEVSLDKGVLAQVDTGVAGKLLSVISLQSLLKRLRLDFSDLMSDKFAFDSLSLKVDVKDGRASTDNARIVGSQATILLSGGVDLSDETVSGRVIVLPEVNAAGASLALAAVNPLVGASAFVAQWLLRHPLNKAFAAEYDLSGTLSSPVLSKRASLRAEP